MVFLPIVDQQILEIQRETSRPLVTAHNRMIARRQLTSIETRSRAFILLSFIHVISPGILNGRIFLPIPLIKSVRHVFQFDKEFDRCCD